MFWFSRRRYSDPIQKIWVKYFISTQIKESNINCFDSEYIELLTSISKDEVPKTDLYASTENDERDNQQYLIDILQLNNPINEDYLKFMKVSLDIFNRNDNKEIKQLNNIIHLFFRVIIRFIYLFTTQVEQKNSPLPDTEDSPQKYSTIISVSFRIFKQYENDILTLLKPFFVCLLNNSDFIMSNNTLRFFTCTLFQQLLEYIKTIPFSVGFHIFLFSAMINYFRNLKNQMEKSDLLTEEVENMKEIISYISENYKTITSKYSTQISNFLEALFDLYTQFPLKNGELYYSLGICSLNFYKNCIKINSTHFLNNTNFLNSILFLIWSVDTFPIENFPPPTIEFTKNFVNSISQPNDYLSFEFIESPSLFSLKKEGFLYPFGENMITEKVITVFDLYIEILSSTNNYDFNSKIFDFLSKKLINSIDLEELPLKTSHDFNAVLFYISFVFSYIGLNLTLRQNDNGSFVILFNKSFYIDNEENYFVHTYFRSFIFRLFAKIFETDPILVIEGFQQVLNESQLHVCDEIFLFLSYLLKKNSLLIIHHLNLTFYPKFFYLLQKLNEKRILMFTFVYNVFENDEGRTKFLSYESFVRSIFRFLFCEQTREDASKFILSAYEKENNLECFNIVYKIASDIFDHSKLPEKKWIDFFMNFVDILNPILKKSRRLIRSDSDEFSNLFESLKNIFCSLKNKEEKCLVSPFLNLITIFTSNNDLYRKKCIKFYVDSLPIFNNITIDNVDDEIINSMMNHIFECKIDSISDPIFTELMFKNANALVFLHNSIKNYTIHKNIFESLGHCFDKDLANQVLLSQSDFPFVLIDFLKNNMNHSSFSVFLQLFDYVFGNNFDIKHFLYLCKSPPNSDIETQNNWKRYSFQLIEALSARNEKELSLRYAFLNGERSEVSFIDDLAISFEIKLNFFIRSFPKKNCSLVSFFSRTKQASDLFSIDVDKEGKISIAYHSFLVMQNPKPSLIYKIDTEIQLNKQKNIELIINCTNNSLNFVIKEDGQRKEEENDEEKENNYEIKCQIPEFLSQNRMRITLFNSAKKAKKHSICAFLFYFSLTLNNSKKTFCCLNLYTEYVSSNHMNKISDFEINAVVKYHVTSIFTFLKKESGTYLLLELIDNSILFLHFIHIIANLMQNSEKFEEYFFKYIFHVALVKIHNLNLSCWTQTTIKSFSKFTLKLADKNNSEQLIENIWLNFDKIWLKLEDKEIQHFTFSEIIPKFFSDFKEYFNEKTDSKTYIKALQTYLCLNDNDEIIMNDLLNILFLYLKIGFSENDLNPIVSFIFNSDKINLRIQFNLRLFGILDDDFSLLDKFNINDQYQFLILFLNDLGIADRNYFSQFMTEKSFNSISNSFIENKNIQNIFLDVLIIHSEFVRHELLLNFISKITNDSLISKILSSTNLHLRTLFLIFIQFHSSSEKVSDISNNQILINFYTLLLSKYPTFIKNFIVVTQICSSFYRFDSIPFLRSIFLSILSQKALNEKIELIIIYAFSFIFYTSKNEYYYNHISLYNSMDDQYHIENETFSELKQISLFEFLKIIPSIDDKSVLPVRFSLRIDKDGKWLDKELALSLINAIETNKKFDFKFNFTSNQAIYGIQMVSMLYVSLVKSDHSTCWDSISFFLKNYPIVDTEIPLYLKSSIQIVCYSLVPELSEYNNFENSFRLFCNRFYPCFEDASQTLSNDVFLNDSMKAAEMNIIINSFSEVYYYQLLLMKNYGIYLSMLCADFIKDFDESLKMLTKLPSIKKMNFFNPIEFINSLVSEFKYTNNLNCIKLLNSEGKIEKPFLFFNDSFHPVMFTSFSMKFVENENRIDFNEKSILIKHMNILTLKGKIPSFYVQQNDTIIIGGYLSKFDSIKWVFQRSPNILEFFYKSGGLMLLVEFESVLNESFINQFPVLDENEVIEKWKDDKLTNYDLILQLNFTNGRSFNDFDSYVIFPRLMENVISNSSAIKECSFRDFQMKLKNFDFNKICDIHNHSNVLNYLDEEHCELIPELYSINELTSPLFTKSHLEYIESAIASSQIHLWIKNVFDVDLPAKELKIIEKKSQYEIVPINKVAFRPFDVFDGSFYSISNDNQIIISKYKNGVLVHFKVPFEQPFHFKNAKLFACPKDKLISIYRRNYTGFTFYSYESTSLKIKEKVIMSSLIDKIERINEDKYYIITSSKRMIICDNFDKVSSFLEGIDIITAHSNYFLNLMIVLCEDGNVIFVSIDSLMFQKKFIINQNDVKWCILDNKGNSILANETEIVSYDVNGNVLASTKSKRNLTLISHIVIQNDDFLVIATEKPNLYIVNTETLENVYTVRTAYPVVSFQFDYKTHIAIIFDNWSTFFIHF